MCEVEISDGFGLPLIGIGRASTISPELYRVSACPESKSRSARMAVGRAIALMAAKLSDKGCTSCGSIGDPATGYIMQWLRRLVFCFYALAISENSPLTLIEHYGI